jgi:hypothetical protein
MGSPRLLDRRLLTRFVGKHAGQSIMGALVRVARVSGVAD